MKTVRIGSVAGYAGDRIEPAIDLMKRGNLDYIIFECLAERTIALAQLRKLKNPDKGKSFLNGDYLWTRDSWQGDAGFAEFLSPNFGGLSIDPAGTKNGVRPTFVIDLSQVDYKVAGHTDYK